jgi:hypothetical protein
MALNSSSFFPNTGNVSRNGIGTPIMAREFQLVRCWRQTCQLQANNFTMTRRLTLILAGFFSLMLLINTDTQAQFTAKRHGGMVRIAPPENSEVSGQGFAIVPAAVKKSANVIINADHEGWATLTIKNTFGEVVLEQQMAVSQGQNKVPIFFISKLEKGVYASILRVEDKVYTTELVKE